MNNTPMPLKILIIDDEVAIRNSFSDYLEDRNYKILTAENGRSGIELIESEQPHVILVDLRMPEMDGIEVLKLGSKIAPDTPKIVISGANQIGDVVQALRYGAWDYLVKPVKDLSILEYTVEKVLEKARLIHENRVYQKHLEKLVQERTVELEQSNKHLSNINSRLRKIVETTQGLSGCVKMQHFGSQILDQFAHHMVATGGSLYFVEEGGLRRIHSLDPGHAPDFLNFPLSEHSVLGQVMKTKKPLLIDNVKTAHTVKPSGWIGYKDGSLLAFPIPDGSGNTVGILTLHNKVEPPFLEQDKEIGSILASYSCETLRAVKAFEALKKSENQHRTLFERTNDAVFIVEKNTGRYLDANEAAARLTGRTLDELKQMTISDISSEGSDERLLIDAESDKAMDLGTITYSRPDNTNRIARLSTVPLNDYAVIGIARDITHELEVEKQLRQSQKMEAIGTLAGGIAHDFNNILSSIFGYAELAQLDIHHPDKLEDNIDQIIKGAKRATELVKQILTFSRQTEQQKIPIKLHLIVKETIKFLRSSIPSTIEIKEKISSKRTVLADSTQTHQVVMNLCTNAYHAMRDTKGVLTIELSDIDIQANAYLSENIDTPGTYAKLEVKDTGHGMDKETLEKIFNPYYTTKQPDKGTGLGLAVVDGIIKNHNGFIKVFSRPDHGSTFQVFLPIVEVDDSLNIPDNEQAIVPKGTEHIFLVDDEEDIIKTSQTILERHGYKVTSFNDGLSALKAFEENPDQFDLVITDLAMPKISGDKLSLELIKIRSDIPILLCTGFSDSMSEKKAAYLGIMGFLYKPIVIKDLISKIREVLDKNNN